MRWLAVLLLASCAGQGRELRCELRHEHRRALTLSIRDDDTPTRVGAGGVSWREAGDPSVPALLPEPAWLIDSTLDLAWSAFDP